MMHYRVYFFEKTHQTSVFGLKMRKTSKKIAQFFCGPKYFLSFIASKKVRPPLEYSDVIFCIPSSVIRWSSVCSWTIADRCQAARSRAKRLGQGVRAQSAAGFGIERPLHLAGPLCQSSRTGLFIHVKVFIKIQLHYGSPFTTLSLER